MRKNKASLVILGLSVLSIMFVILSGLVLLNPYQAKAEVFCQSQITCPDGRKLTCKGSSCSANESDPNDPSCTADGKTKRCSDPIDANDSNKDKKKKDKKDGSNANTSVVSNTNGNIS